VGDKKLNEMIGPIVGSAVVGGSIVLIGIVLQYLFPIIKKGFSLSVNLLKYDFESSNKPSIIECPNCGKQYSRDLRRKLNYGVECSHCQHVWSVEPDSVPRSSKKLQKQSFKVNSAFIHEIKDFGQFLKISCIILVISLTAIMTAQNMVLLYQKL
jgi:hypothetical protein